VNDEIQTYIKVVGLLDINLEIERLRKRKTELQKLIESQKKKMSTPNYEEKVPESVRLENAEKLGNYETERGENDKSMNELAGLI